MNSIDRRLERLRAKLARQRRGRRKPKRGRPVRAARSPATAGRIDSDVSRRVYANIGSRTKSELEQRESFIFNSLTATDTAFHICHM